MATLEKFFSSDSYEAKYQVDHWHDGKRLDEFMKQFMPTFSREEIKRRIDAKDIQIISRPAANRPSTKVYEGDIVIFKITKTTHEDELWRGEKIDLPLIPEVVYEDEGLLVINKPPFMSTHPTGRHLFNCATVFFESIYKKTVHSIHRLDRETSGLLLLGKNPKVSASISGLFEEDKVHKCYFFISRISHEYNGKLIFTANERLGSPTTGRERVLVTAYPFDSEEGKEAETLFKIIHIENGYAVGLAFPVTGRQHQIRVHAATHGLPLVGDKIYLGGYALFQRFKDGLASDEDHDLMELPRQALHAFGLRLFYQEEYKIFHSAFPKDLKEWVQKKLMIPVEDLLVKAQVELLSTLRSK